MKHLVIIPARMNSKGIPRKNLKVLASKPLIEHSVDCALNLAIEKTLIINTDIPEEKLSMKPGVIYYKRPSEVAKDDSTMEETLLEMFASKPELSDECETCILLQPSSPLRTTKDVIKGVNTYFETSSSLTLSAKPVDPSYQKLFVETSQNELIALKDGAPFANRQSLPKLFKPTGAVYIFNTLKFIENKGFPLDRVTHFLASSESEIDLDTKEDWDRVEKIMEAKTI